MFAGLIQHMSRLQLATDADDVEKLAKLEILLF